MTAEQAARMKARSYALIGAGIAGLVAAYQFATTQSPEGPWSPAMPFLFGGAGFILIAIGAYLLMKVGKADVEPAAKTDLSGPQGKVVIGLLVLGLVALAGSYFVDYLVQDENVGLVLSIGLLVVMIVCFVIAARIARKMRAAAGAPK